MLKVSISEILLEKCKPPLALFELHLDPMLEVSVSETVLPSLPSSYTLTQCCKLHCKTNVRLSNVFIKARLNVGGFNFGNTA
jgi:hypothetical protein